MTLGLGVSLDYTPVTVAASSGGASALTTEDGSVLTTEDDVTITTEG